MESLYYTVMNKYLISSREKSRWNWPLLKVEFFASDFKEVKGFFQHQYGTFNSTIKHKAIGWSKEKSKFHQRTYEKAIDMLEEEQSIDLAGALRKILQALINKIDTPEKAAQLSVYELKILWEILRTENGLPLAYCGRCCSKPHQIHKKEDKH